MRIVSLLPSTTEILFAIGAGDDVVGVTFECDYPEEARTRRIVSTSAMPEGLTPAEIDAFVVEAMRRGDDLYHLDEGALAGLDADLVVTQDLCAVCAVDVSVVDDALAHLGCTAEVLTIDPYTLDEVFASIETLGKATGHDEEAARLVAVQRRRLAAVWARAAWRAHRPRVMFLEWTDPPFAPGHWIPEMIELAGGVPLLGTGGEKSRRVAWDDVHAAEPGRRRGGAVRLRPRGQPGPRGPAGGAAAYCRTAYPCTPSTPTPRGPGPAPAWSTVSRSWPCSCTPDRSRSGIVGDNDRMTELPRKAAVRTARLAALPLGYAGRTALGLGKRLGGKSAEAVLTEVQQRTAEQLFRTLGELKGGAMKFGQALSVLEAALPDELVAPYREHLTALQDSAPAMPAAMAYEEIEDALGPDWRDQLVEMDETAAAAASIGQVHRGRWHDGREVAIKVQYPGAGRRAAGRPASAGAGGARAWPRCSPASTSSRWSRRCRRAPPTSSTTASRPRRRRRSPTRSAVTPRSWCPRWSPSASACWSASGWSRPSRWHR